jgi:hypothetical protein
MSIHSPRACVEVAPEAAVPLGSAPVQAEWPDEPVDRLSIGELGAAISTRIVVLVREHIRAFTRGGRQQ